jgi:hypothetical protein
VVVALATIASPAADREVQPLSRKDNNSVPYSGDGVEFVVWKLNIQCLRQTWRMSQCGVLLALAPNMSPVRRGERLFLASQIRGGQRLTLGRGKSTIAQPDYTRSLSVLFRFSSRVTSSTRCIPR